jgi:hypothetical protein
MIQEYRQQIPNLERMRKVEALSKREARLLVKDGWFFYFFFKDFISSWLRLIEKRDSLKAG